VSVIEPPEVQLYLAAGLRRLEFQSPIVCTIERR